MYLAFVAEDGTVSFHDVVPGQYEFAAAATRKPKSRTAPTVDSLRPLATVRQDIVVDAGGVDDSIPLGELSLDPSPELAVGDVAPELKASAFDGKPFALSSLKGKIVLVDVWATWCGPCIREMPNLTDAYAKWGQHPDVAIVCVSFDDDLNAARPSPKATG